MTLEEREFAFSDSDFKAITGLVGEKTGISLGEHKRNMVYSRLARRLRALKLTSFKDYLDILSGPAGEAEIVDFVNAITTNLTKFFRESQHFDHLKDEVLIPLVKERSSQKRVRIWSAGCSSGMEPYSIAMIMHESIPDVLHWDAKILATDIDTNMLSIGTKGVYEKEKLQDIPIEYQRKYIVGSRRSADETIEMSDKLKKLISFKELNLLSDWPLKGPFDVIFCRNVVIYFDKPTQKIIFDKYADLLKPNGWLYIGHSENLFNVTDRFDSLGKTIYQRVK